MAARMPRYIRMLIVIAGIAMLFYMPTREFLKITFMMGIPFVFLLGVLIRHPRYSPMWIVVVVALAANLGAYGYMLIHLPERIQVRAIVSEGGALVAEGQYDAAIAEFRKLEGLGQTAKMQDKISWAQKEKKADEQLKLARQLLAAGKREEADQVIKSIPADTRAAQEARKLIK